MLFIFSFLDQLCTGFSKLKPICSLAPVTKFEPLVGVLLVPLSLHVAPPLSEPDN